MISECCYDDTIKHFSHIYTLNPTWPPCDVFVLLLFYVKIDLKKLTLNGHHVVFADQTHWSQSWWKTNQWTAELILLITCWFQIWSDRINKSRLLSPAALQRSELWRERCLRPFWGSGGRDRTSWCSSRGGLGPAQVRLQVNSDAALMSLCWTGFLYFLPRRRHIIRKCWLTFKLPQKNTGSKSTQTTRRLLFHLQKHNCSLLFVTVKQMEISYLLFQHECKHTCCGNIRLLKESVIVRI